MQAKKLIKVSWEMAPQKTEKIRGWSGKIKEYNIPEGLESSQDHDQWMSSMDNKKAKIVRQDGSLGNVQKAAKLLRERIHAHTLLTTHWSQ